MRTIRALEDVLIRVESALAVVLVLTMLLLAAYNVVYRNVLVPLQNHWAHSGPTVAPPPAEPTPVDTAPAKEPDAPPAEAKAPAETKAVKAAPSGGADDFGGFGGGLGVDDEGALPDEPARPESAASKVAEPKAAEPADDFEGFGGGLDDEAPLPADAPPPPADAPPPPADAPPKPPAVVAAAEPPPEPAGDDFAGFGGGLDDPPDEAEPEAKAAPPEPAGDDFAGFGGGLGETKGETKGEAKVEATPEAKADALGEDALGEDALGEDELGEDDLGDDDQFANLPDIDAAGKKASDVTLEGGPPAPGSFAAWAVAFIDDIKLDWIDIFLRQLVIIVSFFGAMLATQRGKHINVDALSKVLPPGVRRVVAVLLPLSAIAVCLVLARAGWDLVQISRQYPKDLLPSVPEWTLQLMFPVGFGLLATHFAVRLLEAASAPPADATDPPPGSAAPPPGGAASGPGASAADDEDDDDEGAAATASKGGSR